MTMFDEHDPSILWVSADCGGRGEGTFDNPFGSIEGALAVTRPGSTIVLKNGVYSHDVTFDISGDFDNPIRIAAETDGGAVIRGACWFFYDVSDLIVTGFTFRDSPHGSVSVMGSCRRNRFADLTFVNCGSGESASCTLFFGGAGGSCNLVENCTFERAPSAPVATPERATIGLMVGEGDREHGAPIIDHIVRKNRFVNYDYGILVGGEDADAGQCGHIIEYNSVEESRLEGILVKCGDTIVRGNLVLRSRKNSILIAAGTGSVVEANRLIDCSRGISIHGADHTVSNNCIVRCGSHAIHACGGSSLPIRQAAANLIIESNTCVDCGTPAGAGGPDVFSLERVAGVRIDAGVSCVIERNLFAGPGSACAGVLSSDGVLVAENLATHACDAMTGVERGDVTFACFDADDYTNDSGYGAAGWMVMPEGCNPRQDVGEESEGYAEPPVFDDDDEEEPDEEVAVEQEGTVETGGEKFEEFMGRLYKPDVE
jgi:hypothetical protein